MWRLIQFCSKASTHTANISEAECLACTVSFILETKFSPLSPNRFSSRQFLKRALVHLVELQALSWVGVIFSFGSLNVFPRWRARPDESHRTHSLTCWEVFPENIEAATAKELWLHKLVDANTMQIGNVDKFTKANRKLFIQRNSRFSTLKWEMKSCIYSYPPSIPSLTCLLFEGELLWSASASVQWRPSN